MSTLGLSQGDRRLVLASGIDVLVLVGGAAGRTAPRCTVSTTSERGSIALARLDVSYGEPGLPGAISLYVTPRSRLPGIDATATDSLEETAATFLSDSARWMLATNSLELSEGGADRVAQPLDQLIVERHELLPRAQASQLLIDERNVPTQSVAYGRHTAWWSTDATPNSAVVVLARDWSEAPALRSVTVGS